MAEYIEREALGIGKCNLDVFENKDYAKGWNSAIEIIENAPTADVQEVKHGEWEMDVDIANYEYGTCSICGYTERNAFPCGYTPNYCPDCGAKMDKE